jgi:hypothetical protein
MYLRPSPPFVVYKGRGWLSNSPPSLLYKLLEFLISLVLIVERWDLELSNLVRIGKLLEDFFFGQIGRPKYSS